MVRHIIAGITHIGLLVGVDGILRLFVVAPRRVYTPKQPLIASKPSRHIREKSIAFLFLRYRRARNEA